MDTEVFLSLLALINKNHTTTLEWKSLCLYNAHLVLIVLLVINCTMSKVLKPLAN